MLEIEGINSTKTIDSKIYDVPIRDQKKNLHYVQCYGIKSISEVSHVPSPEVYKEICERLQVAPSKVKRPASIDMLLSARSNYLMSDRVLAVSDGLKLYEGPLGLTISGSPVRPARHWLKSGRQKCYPTKATPVVSKVTKTFKAKTKVRSRSELDLGPEHEDKYVCDKIMFLTANRSVNKINKYSPGTS